LHSIFEKYHFIVNPYFTRGLHLRGSCTCSAPLCRKLQARAFHLKNKNLGDAAGDAAREAAVAAGTRCRVCEAKSKGSRKTPPRAAVVSMCTSMCTAGVCVSFCMRGGGEIQKARGGPRNTIKDQPGLIRITPRHHIGSHLQPNKVASYKGYPNLSKPFLGKALHSLLKTFISFHSLPKWLFDPPGHIDVTSGDFII